MSRAEPITLLAAGERLKALFPDGLADFYLDDGTLLKVREGDIVEQQQRIIGLQVENLNLKTALHCGLGQDKYRDGDVEFALERCPAYIALEAALAEAEKDADKWRAVCTPWTDDDTNGVSTWQGYSISHWTGEAWGPDGFEFDEGDIEAAKVACLEHFKTHGVS